jgi:hypothetical protein
VIGKSYNEKRATPSQRLNGVSVRQRIPDEWHFPGHAAKNTQDLKDRYILKFVCHCAIIGLNSIQNSLAHLRRRVITSRLCSYTSACESALGAIEFQIYDLQGPSTLPFVDGKDIKSCRPR